jgi:hypothetical protein
MNEEPQISKLETSVEEHLEPTYTFGHATLSPSDWTERAERERKREIREREKEGEREREREGKRDR